MVETFSRALPTSYGDIYINALNDVQQCCIQSLPGLRSKHAIL